MSDLQESVVSEEVRQPVVRPTGSKPGRSGGVLLTLALVVAIGGSAFAAGRLTAPATASPIGINDGNPRGGFQIDGPDGSPGPGGLVERAIGPTLNGEVTVISEDSITIELEDGTLMTIPIDDSTSFRTASAASAADVTLGSEVSVQAGRPNVQPGASFDPGAGSGGLTFGPASEVTVLNE